MSDLTPFLEPNPFVDSDHPAVVAYAERHTDPAADAITNGVRLYAAIRDGLRYDPWGVELDPAAYRASTVAVREWEQGGHCIDKAILLAACARVVGTPSRMHFAIVRNHIGIEELERQLGTDLLVFHGYVELYLEQRWVSATPAFNAELCERLGVEPLEFDGRHDSIFQQYDREGGRFMEYVHDYGSYPDIPFELMLAEWKKHYPGFSSRGQWPPRPAG